MQRDFKTWQDLFEPRYTRPGDEAKPGGWKTKSGWMSELIRIRNENAHTYSVKESEYNYLVAVHSWLELDKSGALRAAE